MDYKLSPLKESIFIINWLSEHLENVLHTSNKEELHKKDNYILHQLFNLSFIRICVILQEWEKLEQLAKDDKKLRNTLRITSPLIKEIRRWTGLHKFRNSVLAHFGRNQDDAFIPYWRVLQGSKYPTTTWDFNFINSLVITASASLCKRHPHELKQAKKILGRDRARFEEALYNHDLSIKSDDEYKSRKKIVWDKFIQITQEVFEKEKE